MASVNPSIFRETSFSNFEKIENFLSDVAYKEVIENSETFNSRLCIERRLRMPFLDPQTGVAQYHSALFMGAKQRIPGLKEGQVYSYPALRWRKSRRQYLLQKPQPPFPAYTHRPFGNLQSIYDSENSNLDSNVNNIEPESKDHKEDSSKDWYFEDIDLQEGEAYDEPELDSDCDFEESYSGRKKKIKNKVASNLNKAKSAPNDANTPRRGRAAGRGRGRKSQGVTDSPTAKELIDNNKKQRSQHGLPNLTPQPNQLPTVCLEEPAMPILIPEIKMPDEFEEKPQVKAILPIANPTTVTPTSSICEPAVEKGRAIPSPYCDFCLGDARENKKTLEPEALVSCSDCGRSGHPSCLQFTANMIISVHKYRWQCIECKYCTICGTSDNDDQLLFCDDCDRGYHMYCLLPPLITPPEGSWSCTLCTAEFHNK